MAGLPCRRATRSAGTPRHEPKRYLCFSAGPTNERSITGIGNTLIDFLGRRGPVGTGLLSDRTAAEDIARRCFTLADHFFQMENFGLRKIPSLEGTPRWAPGRPDDEPNLELLVPGHLPAPGLLAKT